MKYEESKARPFEGIAARTKTKKRRNNNEIEQIEQEKESKKLKLTRNDTNQKKCQACPEPIEESSDPKL